ncbi:MAG: UDP-N-acetylmuramoyl-tripeptide--D-alanyl-D-alanine ligase, partial [Alphaproteobacteria bacterium]
MNLWTLGEIVDAVGVAMLWKNAGVGSVHTDSREVRAGGLFVALKGLTQHGNDFVPDALRNGAGAILTDREIEDCPVPVLVMNDSYAAFVKLAEAARARFKGPVVVITGSAGKTTTKEFMAAMLEAHAPVGSFNNHVGVPLTLCRLPRDAKAFVAEVGMNYHGEIAPLVKMVRPDVALITNVLPVHVEGLGGIEAIRREKLSIAEGLPNNGTLVVPMDLDVSGVRADVKVVRFDPAAALPVEIVEPSPARVACANAALALARVMGDVTPAMLERLGAVGVQLGRGAAEVVNGVTVIDDSFNGNPASMAAALAALKKRDVAGKRVAVLGDMLELGEGSVGYHVGLAPSVEGIDGVFCVGPLMANLYKL